MNWTPYGPDAWLLRFGDSPGPETFARGRALAAELERRPPPGLAEFVPGFTTLLLEFRPGAVDNPARQLRELARRLQTAMRRPPPPAPVREIPVLYDGPDRARVAEAHGLSLAEVARLHSTPIYRVHLIGFSPGFPYLGDLDARLHTPRLRVPRPRVPAGSVAIGGAHTGIYSVDSPGGWNLIGRTDVRLFDPARRGDGPPDEDRAMFWLKAGDRVRFVPVATLGGGLKGEEDHG